MSLAAGPAAALIPPVSATSVWNGAGDGVHFADATNWVGDALPSSGDRLDISAADCAVGHELSNDLADGFVVGGIDDHVVGHYCTINGNSVVLDGDVDVELVRVTASITLGNDFTLTHGRLETSSFDLAGHTLTTEAFFSGLVSDGAGGGAVIVNDGSFDATGVGDIPITATGTATTSFSSELSLEGSWGTVDATRTAVNLANTTVPTHSGSLGATTLHSSRLFPAGPVTVIGDLVLADQSELLAGCDCQG